MLVMRENENETSREDVMALGKKLSLYFSLDSTRLFSVVIFFLFRFLSISSPFSVSSPFVLPCFPSHCLYMYWWLLFTRVAMFFQSVGRSICLLATFCFIEVVGLILQRLPNQNTQRH